MMTTITDVFKGSPYFYELYSFIFNQLDMLNQMKQIHMQHNQIRVE